MCLESSGIFPLGTRSVISFLLEGHVLFKQLGCLEFLLVTFKHKNYSFQYFSSLNAKTGQS